MRFIGICGIVCLLTVPAYAQWQQVTIAGDFDYASCVYAADVDGDGDLDVLGAAYNADDITWWENLDGMGLSWSQHTVNGSFDGASDVFATDVDDDGDMDILGAAYTDDDITWWENLDGTGLTWMQRTLNGSFDGASSVYAADVDGDGDMDVLGSADLGFEIAWWENLDGMGHTWSQHTVNNSFPCPTDVSMADVDGDGDMDILGASNLGYAVTWWENLDGAGLTWSQHTVPGDDAQSVCAGDVDGDGDMDLLRAAYGGGNIKWLENLDGVGLTWSQHTMVGPSAGASCVYATDMDADGDMDVLGTAMVDDQIMWWENLDGTGSGWSLHTLNGSFDGASSVYAADLDGDGDMDVLGAANIADDIAIWLREGSPNLLIVIITPATDPTVVAAGDAFSYDLEIRMFIEQPQIGYIWTMATLPNGNPYGPLFSTQFLFAPWTSISVHGILQQVPMVAPPGVYTWTVNAGPSLQYLVATDSFQFTVVAANTSSGRGVTEWASNGQALLLAVANDEPEAGIAASGQVTPQDYSISSAYPNPFNPATSLTVRLPGDSELNVVVYNIAGQLIATLAEGVWQAGEHTLAFDGSNLASGLYFVRASVPGQMDQVQKVMLVR